MRKNLVLLFMLISFVSFGQTDLGIIDKNTGKLPRSGLIRLSSDSLKLYFRGVTGASKEVVSTNNTYSNPSWISSLGWSKVTSTPTTIAGYGITDYNALFDTRLATKTTSNITEGSNLYWTNARGDARYFPLTGGTITGTAGNGFIGLNEQSLDPSTPTNAVRIYTDANNVTWMIDETGLKLRVVLVEDKTTFSSISSSAKMRFISVSTDETNGGYPTLYFKNGSLTQFLVTIDLN